MPSWTVDPTLEGLLGTGGVLMSVALFAAPIKTFSRVIAIKSTEDFSPFPYAVTLLSCGIWVFYALPDITPNRFSPLVTNIFGVFFQAVYLTIFFLYAHEAPKKAAAKLVVTFMTSFAIFVGGILMLVPPESRSSVIGMFAAFFTVIMYGAPLSVVGTVLRTQSVEYMPLLLSLNGFICSSTWAGYGVYVWDINIIVPNILGSALGVIQLIVYFVISSRSNRRVGYSPVIAMDESLGLPAQGEEDPSTYSADKIA